MLLAAPGCKKGPASAVDAGAEAVLAYAPPPQEVRYERKRVVGAVGMPTEPVREVWSLLRTDAEGTFYQAILGVDEEGARRVVRHWRYGPDGLAVVADGVVNEDGSVEVVPYLPPEVVLPAATAGAEPWSAEHTIEDKSVTRSCEIQPRSDQCEGEGLIVVCDAQYPDFRVATRDHFCRGRGWSGYEALVSVADRPSVRTWTEGLQRLD